MGYGRLGRCFWGWQEHGVIPGRDIRETIVVALQITNIFECISLSELFSFVALSIFVFFAIIIILVLSLFLTVSLNSSACFSYILSLQRKYNLFWNDPDIVTMAKAAGCGHPLGFVITSAEIANEFGADGSFFSSAGGGPVSCAIGLAVLAAIESERLQENALIVGEYLNVRLKELAAKRPHLVGCIHGHGLYQGVELVLGDHCEGGGGVESHSDRLNSPPATALAYAVCERLLSLGVICHNTGDYSNVLKVKPPLCFSIEDADFFVLALDYVLEDF